jgi:hypothetical protein
VPVEGLHSFLRRTRHQSLQQVHLTFAYVITHKR